MTRLHQPIASFWTGWLVLATLLLPSMASAQATNPQGSPPAVTALPPDVEALTLTPFIGVGFAGDLESTPTDFGVALGYGANQRLSFEGELGIAPSASQGELLRFDTSYWTLSGNVLYHFLQPRFTPYATLGVGLVGSDPDVDPSEFLDEDESSTTTFAWNYGVGIKAALNDRIGVRGDLRYFNAREVAPDHFRIYAGVVIRRLGR